MEAFIRYRSSGTRLQGGGWGYPMMMMMDTFAPLRFIISPKETVIASQYREFGYIPTDGSPMLTEDERWPTIWGTSNGCWEGETLVVEEDGSAGFAPFAEPGFPPAPDFPPEVVLDPAELAQFVGTYGFDNSPASLVVERRGNRLFMHELAQLAACEVDVFPDVELPAEEVE